MASHLIVNIVVMLVPLILAVTVHEYAHVQVARWLGDDTGQRLGRLTLDPLKHIDPVWTVMLPMSLIIMGTLSGASNLPLIGAGRPSPYNPSKLRRKLFGLPLPVRYAELLVAVAGPLSNLLLAVCCTLLMLLLVSFGYDQINGQSLLELLLHFVSMNIALCVFNLIPIPPLDGSKMLLAFLPTKWALAYENVGPTLALGLLFVIILGGGAGIGYVVHAVTRFILLLFLS